MKTKARVRDQGTVSTVLVAGMVLCPTGIARPAAAGSAVAVAQRTAAVARGPRFFVPDFRSNDGKDETSWVALAVSEGLRARLRRSGATTAVSGMRTPGVMERMLKGSDPSAEQIVRLARMLGADWAVVGAVGLNDEGAFVLSLRLCPAKTANKNYVRSVTGPSARSLLEQATDTVLDLAGVKLDDVQRRRVSATPGGSDSAVEYYAKAIRAVRAKKPNDALYYVAQSRRYDASFRPTMKLWGQINIATGNRAEVLMIFQQLLRQARRDDDPVDVVFALTQIAIAHQRARRLKVTEKYYKAALAQARKSGLYDQQAVLLGAMATLRVDERRPEEALALLEERLGLLESQGDRLAMGPACLTVALVCAARDDPQRALRYLNRAVTLADEVGLRSDKAAALYQIGELHKEKGDLDEALNAYRASLEFSEPNEACSAYREIAGVRERQGKLDEALKMLGKAESVLSARRAYAQQANCLSRIARIHAKRGDRVKALSTMTEAVEILSALDHPRLPAYKRELAEMRAKRGAK